MSAYFSAYFNWLLLEVFGWLLYNREEWRSLSLSLLSQDIALSYVTVIIICEVIPTSWRTLRPEFLSRYAFTTRETFTL